MFGIIAKAAVVVAVSASSGFAQIAELPARAFDASDDGSWWVLDSTPAAHRDMAPWVRPNQFASAELLPDQLRDTLVGAPMEFTGAVALSIQIPNPDGGFSSFAIYESPVMHPDLQAMYPEIRTYAGQGVDDPAASVRISMTPAGFAAQVLSPSGTYYVDRYSQHDDSIYASYRRTDLNARDDWVCMTPTADELGIKPLIGAGAPALRSSGTDLRTYRCAIACTGEYTSFHGGSVSAGLAAIVTTLNRVTGIYEVEVAVRLQLEPNNTLLVYTNSGSDPYTNSSGGTMLGENISNLSSIIGNANFDIGHVFSTGGGGVAYLGVVCGGNKAGGVTGRGAPVGDAFDVDYVAHEMGHQFGGNHTFNGVNGSCAGGNRNGSTAYEPGSGSTIQAYAGICGGDDLQNNSDPYFHSLSYDEIRSHVLGNGCAVVTATGNNAPSVSAGASYTIPIGTPFELTASGSDPDSDPLTYCWEERDLGSAISLGTPDNGSSPLFRSFIGTISPTRSFPRIGNILSNTNTIDEHMPATNRTMTFRVTARDNRALGGGVEFAQTTVTSTTSAGPFEITSQNTGGTHVGVMTVTWDVANTDTAPVSTPNVDILLSTDGGQTFPHVLASGTPNDGAETVGIPVNSVTARIKIKGSGNAFFDINNANISVEPSDLVVLLPSGAPGLVAPGASTTFPVEIQPGSSTLVPGTEQLHYRFDGGAYQTISLTALGGDTFEATLPAADCADTPEFYVSGEAVSGSTVTNPTAGASTPYTASVGEEVIFLSDNAETDIGWSVSGDASDGHWDRGVPVNAGRGDPAGDADGSGQAWLSDNDASNGGNSDIDGGQTFLTSPTFDLSTGATVSYQYWLNDIVNGEIDGDSFDVDISTDGGSWTTIRSYTTAAAAWRSDTILVGIETATSSTVRFRIVAEDVGNQNVIETGFDDFVISRFECVDPPVECAPDITTQGAGVGDPGYGVPDGTVTAADINYYINAWGTGELSVADVTTQGAGVGDPGFGVPDGLVTASDVNYYVNLWVAGCP